MDEIRVAPFKSNDSVAILAATNESNESDVSDFKGNDGRKVFEDSKALTEISLHSPCFSVTSDESDDDDNGTGPQSVKEAVAHGDVVSAKGGEASADPSIFNDKVGVPCAFGEEEGVPGLAPSGASGNDGGVPCADPSSSTDPSPSSLSAGSAAGGDADPSRPSSGSFMTRSAELDPFAWWPESLVDHTPDMIRLFYRR